MRNACASTFTTVLFLVFGACSSMSEPTKPPAAPVISAPAAGNPPTVHPEVWPKLQSGVAGDPAIEARVTDLLSRMTVEEKVGQTIQADLGSVTPEEVRQYRLGSILNGGSSGPHGDDRAPMPQWLATADEFYRASMDAPAGHVPIPLLWGTDSMHGNSNIIGATIFPHNVGLGAMRDADLVRRIGEITAIETRVTGQDWIFAPVIAVARDDRWGRTYESYSESPEVVQQYAAALVQGIQGLPGTADFLRGGHMLATAKHFIGDGGTDKGKDQGDTLATEEQLRDIHSAGYQSAIPAGVQTIMVSFSSWNGEKMSANRALLEDVLRGRLSFNGFTVSDWNAHTQVPGCTGSRCPAAFLAGIDMFMAPDTWKGVYASMIEEVRSGEIPMARLDEAVARILRVKIRAGLFEEGMPSQRPYAAKWNELGSAEHRAVARQAVRESLVLLKNERSILPLNPHLNVLVTGDGADNMSKQTGGWTISWQGDGNSRADFPNAQTIYEGIAEQVKVAGGMVTFSPDGNAPTKPDVAVVVFGEAPYAEGVGDRPNLAYQSDDPHSIDLLLRLKSQGIPVVGVFLSGRPMYLTPEINACEAFVAAWLPGGEGGGIADLLFRKPDGSIQYDFWGRLSFSWPRSPDQMPLNIGDPAYDPLFPFGYGLDYSHPRDLGMLPEAPPANLAAPQS
ncbi:MAG: glycoside hydrolase family 3 protein [Alphaproteobacteria bacterium]|nr:glycoside hydrolase family 3 protein [Alphaproteobacteria bacterium]